MKTKPFLKLLTVLLLILLGLLAMGGGFYLISDPTGDEIGIPNTLIENTMFNSYLIPGIILFCFVGLFSLFVAFSIILKTKYYHWLIIVQSVLLLVWLTAELIINADFFEPILHFPLYSIALLLLILGIALGRRREKWLEPEEVGSY